MSNKKIYNNDAYEDYCNIEDDEHSAEMTDDELIDAEMRCWDMILCINNDGIELSDDVVEDTIKRLQAIARKLREERESQAIMSQHFQQLWNGLRARKDGPTEKVAEDILDALCRYIDGDIFSSGWFNQEFNTSPTSGKALHVFNTLFNYFDEDGDYYNMPDRIDRLREENAELRQQLEDQRLISWGLANGVLEYCEKYSCWTFEKIGEGNYLCSDDCKIDELTLTDDARAILQQAKEEAE